MGTPKISTKRVLGATAAAALALSGVVGVAGSSQAAVTVAALKLSPSTGSSAGGTIVTIAGKDFQSAAGASKIGTVFFSTSTCAVANVGTNPAAVTSVISATKITVTTPALALTASKPTAYNLCLTDTGDANVIGAAKFTSYQAPTITATGLSTTKGASYGGGSLTITGDNFTTKATATIGSYALTNIKVVVGSGVNDDTLTGTVPDGTGTTLAVKVTTEGGPSAAATQTFDYQDSVAVVAPAYGNGTDNDVIALTGTGFNARTFGAAVKNSAIALVAAGTNIAAGQTVPVTKLCDTVQVESDTSLSCQINGAVADGAYTVVIFTRDATTAANIGAATAISRSATYTVSDY
jgi:IPT/TIG domain